MNNENDKDIDQSNKEQNLAAEEIAKGIEKEYEKIIDKDEPQKEGK